MSDDDAFISLLHTSGVRSHLTLSRVAGQAGPTGVRPTERMTGIIDDIWKYAPIETPYGNIPTHNFEVCGDMLQASARLYWFTGDRKYLDCAIRLGDYFLLGTNHPTRDMKQLRLSDHGCEVINGLSELYVAVSHALPEKKKV